MAFIFILMYFLAVYLVIRISTVLMELTGLSHEVARFQTISMLTGTGFTTSESELVISHPVRRRIGSFLILFGAFSLAVIISTISQILSNSFRTTELMWVIIGMLFFFFFIRIKGIQYYIQEKFKAEIRETFELPEMTAKEVLYLSDNDLIINIPIHPGSRYLGENADDVIEEKEDVNLLYLIRGDMKIREKLYETEIQEGDTLYLYGDKEAIKVKFYHELKEKVDQSNSEIPIEL
ncbi:TrkA C-terminal domain-containing protein [Bacillus marinisedimentorum]|uniref:TrkA C-terminal domain-containing protein n=1 Tax=Bacillus marinisedimentorum TaxID=1821260 RepID=UPI000871B639|nr:TrkA C-terminal domain-containing protein [Bacillus marinisedimentorum]